MINADGVYKDKESGKFRVYHNGEWIYTADTFEEADFILSVENSTDDGGFWESYYGDDGDEE